MKVDFSLTKFRFFLHSFLNKDLSREFLFLGIKYFFKTNYITLFCFIWNIIKKNKYYLTCTYYNLVSKHFLFLICSLRIHPLFFIYFYLKNQVKNLWKKDNTTYLERERISNWENWVIIINDSCLRHLQKIVWREFEKIQLCLKRHMISFLKFVHYTKNK